MIKGCKIDMWYGEAYDRERHLVPVCYWSDGRMCYWGWIYSGEKIVGDFTAASMQDAERELGVKFDRV